MTADLQALAQVLEEFNSIYQDFIPRRDWLQCRLAVAEGFTNAVRHAHRNLPEGLIILIEVLLQHSSMKIKIWDYGFPFDLKEFMLKMSQEDQNWLSSGRGIPILNQIADHLDYYRQGQKNCLLIVKNFSPTQNKDI